ncbi:MAG: 6-bladed beta-propeller [Bacteroidales bacterium]|nr:6-bladed beta-propeller [Bacteroidales bacterium]
MKPKNLFLMVFILFLMPACKSPEGNIYKIDPRTFVENKITLDDLADDIIYIPLDNRYPIGQIYSSYKILKNSIYIAAQNIGIITFNRDGKMARKIGGFGRGPGEYLYCMSFAVDENTEAVYVMDRNNTIKVFSKNGNFLKSILLPKSEDGFNFSEIDFYYSNLFVSQYINMGHAEYNWIIIDTLGKLIKQKKNSIPAFPSRGGNSGGICKFKNKIYYWNQYNVPFSQFHLI